MSEQYVEPITAATTTAATTLVTASKIGTISSAAIAGSAGYFGDHFFAWAGLIATLFFGLLGTAVSFYFKHKEDKRNEAEHLATMARLTGK